LDEQKLLSLISDQSMASRALAEMGVFSMPIADDMWSLAISQPGIKNAKLEVEGLYGEGELGLRYVLQPKNWLLYALQRWFEGRSSIIKKIGLILLNRWGAPVFVAQNLANQARAILPQYRVYIEYRRKI
jgi:hypothetical protein